MKRERENGEIQGFDIAKCLMLLSHGLETKPKDHSVSEVFECKTCHRRFSSFQALGGHRASHKKPRLMGEKANEQTQFLSLSTKPKTHECSICGQEFSTGQALGGHMRKHRASTNESFNLFPVVSTVQVLKRSNSCRRVVCLDLNLTPLENDLQVLFGTKAPKARMENDFNLSEKQVDKYREQEQEQEQRLDLESDLKDCKIILTSFLL